MSPTTTTSSKPHHLPLHHKLEQQKLNNKLITQKKIHEDSRLRPPISSPPPTIPESHEKVPPAMTYTLLAISSSSDQFTSFIVSSLTTRGHLHGFANMEMLHATEYKVFVSTWNVGAIAPPSNAIALDDWLDTSNSYDIYVLGFQEIVPLSARNVLGPERKEAATKWNSLIGATLNKCSPAEEEAHGVFLEHHHKVYPIKQGAAEFSCIVSKQMVGILISVWARKDLLGFIKSPSVSCVGCGIMGCLKNKGSVSVRFYLHGVSFCFVCCHLSSGEKEGDKRLRNLNLNDILSKTCFANNLSPKILDHDRIVLFGDLNYRISLSDAKTRSLVDQKEWKMLLGKDQLKFELSPRGIFEGWNEGSISFPPTYKYKPNSDEYYWQICGKSRGEKIRAPAWCDRILWIGKGLNQIGYHRCESKLSDHRQVRAIFMTRL